MCIRVDYSVTQLGNLALGRDRRAGRAAERKLESDSESGSAAATHARPGGVTVTVTVSPQCTLRLVVRRFCVRVTECRPGRSVAPGRRRRELESA
jgi:hypothetical protein